jgi:hypothetical protein
MSAARFGLRLLPIVLIPQAFWGQTGAFSSFNPVSASSDGPHLYGVSVYTGYYLSGAPFGLDSAQTTQNASSSPTVVMGASATLGWAKTTGQSTASINYGISYTGSPLNSQYNGFGHRASLNWNRKLNGKWTLSVSASGMLSTFQQLFFSQSGLSALAASPATFQDLSSGALTGTYSNAQVASLLTGAQVSASPEQSYLYGNRIFGVTASAALSWAPTERTSLGVTVSGSRTQNEQGNAVSPASPTSANPLAPAPTTSSVQLSWSYSLSPRTHVSVQASSTEIWSKLDQGYTSVGSLSLSRTLTERWFTQLQGGAGVLTYKQLAFPQPKSLQYTAAASLGYKTTSNTFLVSYNRSIGDTYGLGAATTSAANGAWNWRRPGSTWSVFSSFGYQELGGSTFSNTRSWRGSGGLAKGLGPHVFVNVQYSYSQLPSNLAVSGANLNQNGVVVSASWSPSTYQ